MPERNANGVNMGRMLAMLTAGFLAAPLLPRNF
jgi:hypothetical protein